MNYTQRTDHRSVFCVQITEQKRKRYNGKTTKRGEPLW